MELRDYQLALENPRYLSRVSAWIEHIPFAFALMDWLRPRSFVELGTHAGDSYCAFCQAVQTLKLSTKCTAIDTWQGDSQAGDYGQHILDELRAYHDPLYATFSRLFQSTFDDALPSFENHSIDLLHIDGLHTYEAVKRDLEAWLPKLSERAVVLMHDTQVTRDDFGVYRVWREAAERYPSFEFVHGYGLGVLAVGREVAPKVSQFLNDAQADSRDIQRYFQALGNRLQLARGALALSDALAEQRPVIENVLALVEKDRPPVAAVPRVNLLDNLAADLKSWLDLRGENARLQNHLIEGIAGHMQWLLKKNAELTKQALAHLVPVTLYWPDAKGSFDHSRTQTAQLRADGTLQHVEFSREITGQSIKRLRLDPGDQPAIWLIAGIRARITREGHAPAEIALDPRSIIKAVDALVLHAPAGLDDAKGLHYIFFAHTRDPQIHLRVEGLLPKDATHFALTIDARIFDSFAAFQLDPADIPPHSQPLAELLARLLGRIV